MLYLHTSSYPWEVCYSINSYLFTDCSLTAGIVPFVTKSCFVDELCQCIAFFSCDYFDLVTWPHQPAAILNY